MGCIGAALLLHTLLMMEWQDSPMPPSVTPIQNRSLMVRMHVREISPVAADHAVPAPTRTASAPEPVATTPPSSTASKQMEPSIAATPTPSALAIASPVVDLARDTELYLPRSALSQGASAIGWVEVPYPPGAPLGQHHTELTLYIDETGTVRRVRVDRGDAPAALQDAARQAFLSARFQPGEVNGQPVKSRLRIEVEFSAEALPQH